MRHQKAGRKLNRSPSHREAMLRNLVTSLFEHERIETTDAKAKELRPLAEKMISLSKKGDLHSRRQALAVIRKKEVTHKLFDVLSKEFQGREGGYLRIVKTGRRVGDGAPLSIVELVKEKDSKKAAKGSGKAKKGKTSREKGAETGKKTGQKEVKGP